MRMNRSHLIDAVLIVFLAFLFLALTYRGMRSLSKSHLPGDRMNQGSQ